MSDVFQISQLISQLGIPEQIAIGTFILLLFTYAIQLLIYRAGSSRSHKKIESLISEVRDREISDFEKLLDEGSLVEAAKDLSDEKITPSVKIIEPVAALPDKLVKTRAGFFDKIRSLFTSAPILKADMLEELEYLLIGSDIGVQATNKIIDQLKSELSKDAVISHQELNSRLATILKGMFPDRLSEPLEELSNDRPTPYIVLVVGVNGVGKTTTCAKLASRLSERGLKVLLVAADTFRAAAVQQLTEWANRISVPVISGPQDAKPQSVVFDGMKEAMQNRYDVIIIDTAGRLQNKTSLMQELEGIRNAIKRHFSDAPHDTLLVVDGSTGQNAISQAKEFHEAVSLTGVIITKLDGTPKGGSVVAIQSELGIPVRYIGVGESPRDLRPFEASTFVDAIFDRDIALEASEVVSAHAETRRRRRGGSDIAV